MNGTHTCRWQQIHILTFFTLLFLSGCANEPSSRGVSDSAEVRPLTVLVLGDAGETGSALRACASYVTDMHTGRHDGGKFDAMIFLGDNFYNIGLNGPVSDVSGKVKDVLGRFNVPMTDLGRANVHAIAGNHDYYARNLLEASLLFGLISFEDGPIGLTEKGNQRAAALPEWTYYYRMPAQTTYPLTPGASDSAQFIFLDSALPLRTDPATWRPALDSLSRLLAASKRRPGILWRILCAHHPIYTVGEHGGFTVWNDETNTVEYLTQCDKDSNAMGYIKNMLDPGDLCTEKYQQYLDSLRAVVHASGVRIQVSLAGHDHSLQLLNYPDRDTQVNGWPKVHIVSGAASKPSRVKLPVPPQEFTSADTDPKKEGESVPGFVQLRFEGGRLRVAFFNARSGDWLEMGGSRKEFWLDASGTLLSQ